MPREREDSLANLVLEFEDERGRRWMAAAFLGTLRLASVPEGERASSCTVEAAEQQLPGLRVKSFKVVKYGG